MAAIEVLYFESPLDIVQALPEYIDAKGEKFNLADVIKKYEEAKKKSSPSQIRTNIAMKTHVAARFNAPLKTKEPVDLGDVSATEVRKGKALKKRMSKNQRSKRQQKTIDDIIKRMVEKIKEQRRKGEIAEEQFDEDFTTY